MKKILLAILFFSSSWVMAQENSTALQKGLASFDVGFLGSWLSYEKPLGKQWAFNSQLGMEGGFSGGGGDFDYVFTPTITVEPRFYYNLHKRVNKGRKTMNNSADYLTLAGGYVPALFAVTNEDVELIPQFTLIPKWGLRRTIGQRFKFEFAAGYGLAIREQEAVGQLDLDLNFGYFFFRK